MDLMILLILAVLSFQSFLFSAYLLTLKGNRISSNRLLAAFLILLGTHMAINLVEQRGLTLQIPYLLVISATYGPVLYYYISSLQHKKPVQFRRILPHFIPSFFILILIHFLPKNVVSLIGVGVTIQVLIYLLLGHFSVKKYQDVIRQTQSRIGSISLEWCSRFVAFFALIIVIDVLNSIFLRTTDVFFLLLILGFMVLVNGLLFQALKAPMIFIGITEADAEIANQQREKYKNSKLEPARLEALANRIEAYYVKSKPYLNPEFNLGMLATEIKEPARDISQAINTKFKVNFSDYTNQYRVELAKCRIVYEPKKSISEVLYSVGFNSKSSFYTSFKRLVGVSPKQFQIDQGKNDS